MMNIQKYLGTPPLTPEKQFRCSNNNISFNHQFFCFSEVSVASQAIEVNNEDEDGDDNNDEDLIIDSNTQEFGEDVFDLHLTGNIDPTTLSSLQSNPKLVTTSKMVWPELGEMEVALPVTTAVPSQTQNLLEKQEVLKPATLPVKIEHINWSMLHVKPQIAKFVKQSNEDNVSRLGDELTPLQKEIFSVLNNYQDLFYSDRNWKNSEQVRLVYCLHALNHSLKTRLKVIHHNEKLNKKQYSEVPDEFRDQGLVRPKVLILVPFRHACYR